MDTVQHKQIGENHIHRLVNRTFTNPTELGLASGFDLSDLHTLCYVESDESYHFVTGIDPVTFQRINTVPFSVEDFSFNGTTYVLTLGTSSGPVTADLSAIEQDIEDAVQAGEQFASGAASQAASDALLAANTHTDTSVGNLATALQEAVQFQGTYDVASGMPTPVTTYHDVLLLTGVGSLALPNGTAAAGDWIIYDGAAWQLLSKSPQVRNWVTANNGDDFATAPTATGLNAIAVGSGASAAAVDGVAIGREAVAVTRAVAIGLSATTTSQGGVAIGEDTTAEGFSVVIGKSSATNGGEHVLLGRQNTSGASGQSVVIGHSNNKAAGGNGNYPSVVIGRNNDLGANTGCFIVGRAVTGNPAGIVCLSFRTSLTLSGTSTIFISSGTNIGSSIVGDQSTTIGRPSKVNAGQINLLAGSTASGGDAGINIGNRLLTEGAFNSVVMGRGIKTRARNGAYFGDINTFSFQGFPSIGGTLGLVRGRTGNFGSAVHGLLCSEPLSLSAAGVHFNFWCDTNKDFRVRVAYSIVCHDLVTEDYYEGTLICLYKCVSGTLSVVHSTALTDVLEIGTTAKPTSVTPGVSFDLVDVAIVGGTDVKCLATGNVVDLSDSY